MRSIQRLALTGAIAGLTLGVGGRLYAADGAALFTAKSCPACHGPEGKTTVMPTYPKLAGQNAPYLLAQMQAIRDGVRTNGLTMAMRPIVSTVNDDEFKAIAEWLSGLK